MNTGYRSVLAAPDRPGPPGGGLLAIATLGCLALLAPLVAYGYLGLYSRYAADDYCTAGQLAANGLLGMQLGFYQGWSGRVTFTLTAGLVESVGVAIVPALPALAIVVWTAVLTWSIAPVAAALRWPRPLPTSLLTSLMLVTVTLGTTADLGQSLLWQTGLLTYLLPLVGLSGYVGVVLRQLGRTDSRPTGAGPIAASVLLVFDAGGSSETYVAMQTGLLGLAVLLCLTLGPGRPRRRLLPCLLAGLAVSLAAYVIVVAAPGDTVRQSGHPTPNLWFAVTSGAADVRDFIHGFWRFSPVPALLAAVLPAVVGLVAPAADGRDGNRRQELIWAARALAVLAAATLVALALCFAPSYYALSSPAPGRARLIPQFLLVVATAVGGYAVARLLRAALPAQHRPTAVLAGVSLLVAFLGLTPALLVPTALAQTPGARLYASQWDAIDAQIRAARASGVQDIEVAPLTAIGAVRDMDFLAPDSSNWLNQCASRYYRVHTLAAPDAATGPGEPPPPATTEQ